MAFSLISLFRRNRSSDAADRLYAEIVAQARDPAFFAAGGAPDAPEGRFAMIALHAFLVMDRLGREPGMGELSQALFDAMFADMDRNLREMGVGDLSVGAKVKNLAQEFYATAASCKRAMNAGDDALRRALEDDLFGGIAIDPPFSSGLADYVRACEAALAAVDAADLASGDLRFADPAMERSR